MLNLLPREIFLCYLLKLLSPQDVVNLCLAFRIGLGKEVYHDLFHDNIRLLEYEAQEFQERARVGVYVLGHTSNSRLGVSDKGHWESVYTSVRTKSLRRASKVRVKSSDIVLLAGFSGCSRYAEVEIPGILVLNRRGDLYCTAKGFGRIRGRQRTRGSKTTMLLDHLIQKFTFCSELPRKQTRFEEVSCGIGACLIVDDTAHLWMWEFGHNMQAVPFVLVRNHKLLKVASSKPRLGVKYGGCLDEGRRVVFWRNRSLRNDGIWNGYPGIQGWVNVLQVSVVPDSEDTRDFMILGDLVVCLNKDGSVCAINLVSLEKDYMAAVNTGRKFVQIFGSDKIVFCVDRAFALVSADGTVVTVSYGYSDKERKYVFSVFETIEGLDVASVALGESHCLALTTNKEVYAWGAEACYSGCLGLGKIEDVEKNDNLKEESRCGDPFLFQSKPRKLKLPGPAYAVTAGVDYSAILVCDHP